MPNIPPAKGPNRRNFLKFGAAASATLAAPPAKATIIKAPQTPRLLKNVLSFIARGPFSCMDSLDELKRYQPILAAPPDYGKRVSKTIEHFRHLEYLAYACLELRDRAFKGVTLADIVSPQWEALEEEWFPVVENPHNDYHQTWATLSESRQNLVTALRENSFPENTLLAQAGNFVRPRCIAAAKSMFEQCYRHDPAGFVRKFHEHPSNVGLRLHQFNERSERGDTQIGYWIPKHVARHIEAMYPFSGWAAGKNIQISSSLMGRIFNIEMAKPGGRLYHIALPAHQAYEALNLAFDSDIIKTPSLRTAKGGGMLLRLKPDQMAAFGQRLTPFLPSVPAEPQPEPILATIVTKNRAQLDQAKSG